MQGYRGLKAMRTSSYQIKPSNRIIWHRSPACSFLSDRGIQAIPAVIIRVYRYQIGIRIRLDGNEKIVNVIPVNVILKGEVR